MAPRVFDSLQSYEAWKRDRAKPRGRGGVVPTAEWRAQRMREVHEAVMAKLVEPPRSPAERLFPNQQNGRGATSPLGGQAVAKEMKR
jgi:hypothetical protein